MQRIIVVCAGGHGRVVADILAAARLAGDDVLPVGFVDDTAALAGATVSGLPVLGPISALRSLQHDAIVIALGDNPLRRGLSERLVSSGERLCCAVHPRATVAASVQMADGSVICAGAVLQPGVKLGRGVIINTCASADHDTTVGDFAHLSPGATVGAYVAIGDEALVAVGASVVGGRQVGARSVIGAGAVVVRDIPADVVAFGNPARIQAGRSEQASSGWSDTPESPREARRPSARVRGPATESGR